MKYQKLCHFIEPYHAPYTTEQCYWTGLLLLLCVLLYTVSATNTSGDPRVSIVTITIIIGCLLLIKGVLANNNRLVDAIETTTYFNILAIGTFTWYTLDTDKNQDAVAYTSVMITFALLFAVIIFHVYKYSGVCSIIQKSQLYKLIKAKMQMNRKKQQNQEDATDAVPQSIKIQKEPTYSVIEIHIPQL